ncbi:hypothetical protein [Hoeflea sp.]|uniref:hypothetical protein n=1 Tax=Hoeflea sp. TaxID=1940281 RepID=UPI003B52B68F
MSLETKLTSLATRMGQEAKALRTLINNNAANLNGLNTTAKTSLVAAINELDAAIASLSSSSSGIDDLATDTDTTWSSTKIAAEIVAAVNGLIDGAPGAIDTLNELAAAIGDDANFAGTVTTALANRIRFDAAQTLSGPQQAQACANIGVGNPEVDLVGTFETALA